MAQNALGMVETKGHVAALAGHGELGKHFVVSE